MNDKYLQYEIEDFLNDDKFVNWVLDGADDDLWATWAKNNESRRSLIEVAKRSILQLKFVEPSSKDISVAQQRVWEKIEQSTETKTISLASNRRRWLYSIAAVAAITLLGIMVLPEKAIIVTSEIASTEYVTLPSDSKIILEGNSKISYKSQNWEKSRNVKLDGLAEFKVSKGVPFSVLTDNGSVEVLGTEFNVVSVDDIFQVKVTEGRVSVTSGNHQKILTAGMAFYKNPKWKGDNVLSNDWLTEDIYFAFEERPLSEVLSAIQFSTDSKIETNGIDTTMPFTGSFDSSQGIEVSLETVLWPLGIEFSMENKTIQLRMPN